MSDEIQRFTEIANNFWFAMNTTQSVFSQEGYELGETEQMRIASVILIVDAINRHWMAMP